MERSRTASAVVRVVTSRGDIYAVCDPDAPEPGAYPCRSIEAYYNEEGFLARVEVTMHDESVLEVYDAYEVKRS